MLKENDEYVELYKIDESGNIINTGDIIKRGIQAPDGLYVMGINNYIVNLKRGIFNATKIYVKKK